MRKFSKLARSARSHIHRISSMLLFCRYFVVYSAIPQVIKVNCIDCICIYTDVLMSHVFMYLRDFSRFFHLKKKNYADPVSVYVMLYVIILIHILIRYNVKNLITACTRSLDFDLKIEKSPYPGRGDTPLPDPPTARSLRSLAFVTFPLGAPPNALTPRYATASTQSRLPGIGFFDLRNVSSNLWGTWLWAGSGWLKT